MLVQPEGLSGEPTLADVFVATAPRRFAKKKARTVLRTGAVWWSVENDWSGDGRADVVVLDGDVLQFHFGLDPAQATSKKKRRSGYWEAEPSMVLRLSDSPIVSGAGTDLTRTEQAAQQALAQMGASVLQRVWVDSGTMVIPAVFEREAAASLEDDGEVVSVGYEDEDSDQSAGGSEGEPEVARRGVIYVVRSGSSP